MESRKGSIADSASTWSNSAYSNGMNTYATALSPPPLRRVQTSLGLRKWGFRKNSIASTNSTLKEGSVAIRESVTYPSESEFEKTIEKGTAQVGRRQPIKARLVDLGRKVQSIAHNNSLRHIPLINTPVSPTSSATAVDTQSPSQVTHRTNTSHEAATDIYHDTHSDTAYESRARSPAPREPLLSFRDRIPGGRFNLSAEKLQDELSAYKKTYNRRKARRSCGCWGL
ncbi:hypothetical protein F5Y04DRAFT_189815 [Hypomontagnella monticulosa]|nr:hypothetical protein F5Y04DRAFT_189815 [Hypomontagnella monticulosa]